MVNVLGWVGIDGKWNGGIVERTVSSFGRILEWGLMRNSQVVWEKGGLSCNFLSASFWT